MILSIAIVIIICVVLFLANLVNASCAKSVKRLFNTEDLFERVSSISDVGFDKTVSASRQWAKQNGFELESYFLLHASDSGVPTKCCAWWSEKYRTYFLFYVAEENGVLDTAHDFYTLLSNGMSLATATTANSLLLPRPKLALAQCVKSSDLTFVMKNHLRSVKSICDRKNTKVSKDKEDLLIAMGSFLKQQAELVMDLPLWRHRGAYWYFVKKHILSLRRY